MLFNYTRNILNVILKFNYSFIISPDTATFPDNPR